MKKERIAGSFGEGVNPSLKTVSYRTDAAFAEQMDRNDLLNHFRHSFHFPKDEGGKSKIYLCGNSLGLQPITALPAMVQELEDWGRLGVDGHFPHMKDRAWLPFHRLVTEPMANIVGAKPSEVVAMGTLTSNLHLLMTSFYRPQEGRYRILMEDHAFPSDQYAIATHMQARGQHMKDWDGRMTPLLNPNDCITVMKAREGEVTLRTEDILHTIETEGDQTALILISGINYYTGQLFDVEAITKAGHERGCVVGFDMAHAFGNAALKLHDAQVDFAAWCHYKYGNSGPGAVAGLFVHENYHDDVDIPRHAGWWGNRQDTRFQMKPQFEASVGAEAWQQSNPPIFSLVPVAESLRLMNEAGIENLREKSVNLTGYMEFLLNSLQSDAFKVITPEDPKQRGAQLSIVVKEDGKKVHEALEEAGVVCDWREPDCIRVAPAPLYNSYQDVRAFVSVFARQLGLDLDRQAQPGPEPGTEHS